MRYLMLVLMFACTSSQVMRVDSTRTLTRERLVVRETVQRMPDLTFQPGVRVPATLNILTPVGGPPAVVVTPPVESATVVRFRWGAALQDCVICVGQDRCSATERAYPDQIIYGAFPPIPGVCQ